VIAVVFEVQPASGQKEEYLSMAEKLLPVLTEVEGFISIERFQSLSNPEKLLSLSFFQDEQAIEQWRNLSAHRSAQAAGRKGIFRDYRIRIAEVIRDYGMIERDQAPADSRTIHVE